ncbi:MAG TPA: phosphopantetheine-binding protein [Acidimicrobiales bacterium]
MDDRTCPLPERIEAELHGIITAIAADLGVDPLDLGLRTIADMDSLVVLETTLTVETLTGVELELDDAKRCETLRDLVSLALTKRALHDPTAEG